MHIKKFLVVLPAIALIAAGCGNSTVSNTNTQTTPPPAASNTNSTMTVGQTVEVSIAAKNFAFDPTTIKVKKGDRVKLTFNNQVGTHDWVVDEFDAKTKIITGQGTDTIEFVADKTGSFEYYCSVGTHRQMGMKGTLIVE